ncbi:Os09g0445801 [Oryza sativa Japonica Group]|uniref:Os09g0445801 protein n=1 Tax=Oryza sativa subsp. japonica TaxID=39947 RepID=A0A0P0XNS0_ORYSJ|nr:hypothetical protein EE612_048167 [Oryza sativa]BAT08339.1 Os09g0445801 [Oryza sativa Japonica Group]
MAQMVATLFSLIVPAAAWSSIMAQSSASRVAAMDAAVPVPSSRSSAMVHTSPPPMVAMQKRDVACNWPWT